MDIVLSLCDTLFFDHLYASLIPRDGSILLEKLYNIAPGGAMANGSATAPQLVQSIPELSPITIKIQDYLGLQESQYATLSGLPRDNIYRQFLSLWLIVWGFGIVLYFVSGTLSYLFIFDKDTFKHPKYLKNQIRQEIATAMWSMPTMALLTAPFFLVEIRGYSKLYENIDDYGKFYLFFQFPLFLLFTDGLIYLIHRALHSPFLYRRLHKPHHKWIMPTPFASHAFHPVDGWSQSLPYHFFPFIFPLHKVAYVGLFSFINIWTVLIHDGEYMANSPIINGAACHTMHHLYFNYNFGQFTTLWDRLGGSYRKPNIELFYKETKMSNEEWKRQQAEMEKIVNEVEGDDSFREYNNANGEKKTN